MTAKTESRAPRITCDCTRSVVSTRPKSSPAHQTGITGQERATGRGDSRSAEGTVLRARDWSGDAQIAEVAAGSWRAKERDAISSSGYVLHTLEAALWCVGRSESIEDALILAANLAGDADTVAAVTGQFAGALWGMADAPSGWLAKLAWREHIEALAAGLFEAASSEQTGGY